LLEPNLFSLVIFPSLSYLVSKLNDSSFMQKHFPNTFQLHLDRQRRAIASLLNMTWGITALTFNTDFHGLDELLEI